MKRITLLAVALFFALATSQTTYAQYRIEHTPLDQLVGQYTVDDLQADTFQFYASFAQINFDIPIDLQDIDQLTIHITGSVSPVTLRGDGVIRPAQDYTINTGIDTSLTTSNFCMLVLDSFLNPQEDLFDDDPAFDDQWRYQPLNPIVCSPNQQWLCSDDSINLSYNQNEPLILSAIKFNAGTLTSLLHEIPWLEQPACDPFTTSGCDLSEADGLEVVSPIEVNITSAYLTREWNIPEPASLTILTAATLTLTRRQRNL